MKVLANNRNDFIWKRIISFEWVSHDICQDKVRIPRSANQYGFLIQKSEYLKGIKDTNTIDLAYFCSLKVFSNRFLCSKFPFKSTSKPGNRIDSNYLCRSIIIWITWLFVTRTEKQRTVGQAARRRTFNSLTFRSPTLRENASILSGPKLRSPRLELRGDQG